MILYKCHLFGVSPPALTSSVGAPGAALQQQSSAAWRAHELLSLVQMQSFSQPAAGHQPLAQPRRQSDCSLCANVERKYQCAWCANQCQHAEQCQELAASTCPPPRIDSVSSWRQPERPIVCAGRPGRPGARVCVRD